MAVSGPGVLWPPGRVLWPADVPISTAPGEQGIAGFAPPGVVSASDSAGGAFLIWESRGNGTIYAQRVDGNGEALWQANGIQVAPGPWYEGSPTAVADGEGGAVVAWVDGRNGFCGLGGGTDCNVFAQRLSSSGDRLWGVDGVPVTVAPLNQGISGIGITTDGSGGAIVAWEDGRPPHCCSYFAQRIDAVGQAAWATDGIPVSPPPTIVIGPVGVPPSVVTDASGGAYVTWLNQQTLDRPTLNIQHVTAEGQISWSSGGLPVGFPYHKSFFATTSDGAGGVLATWSSRGTDLFDDIRAQRISADGSTLWATRGVPVVTAPLLQGNPRLVSDGAGGAIISWEDNRHDWDDWDIYAQRIDASGRVLWPPDGVPISLAPNDQFAPRLVSDGAGGAIIAWEDCRDFPGQDCLSGMDLYTQHVDGQGRVLAPRNGAPLSSAPGNQGVHYGSNLTPSFAMVSDGVGGAILAWPDGRHGACFPYSMTRCELYAQRVRPRQAPSSR